MEPNDELIGRMEYDSLLVTIVGRAMWYGDEEGCAARWRMLPRACTAMSTSSSASLMSDCAALCCTGWVSMGGRWAQDGRGRGNAPSEAAAFRNETHFCSPCDSKGSVILVQTYHSVARWHCPTRSSFAMALDSLIASLPPDLKQHVQLIVSDPEPKLILDNLINFALSQPRPSTATDEPTAWDRAQLTWRTSLTKLNPGLNGALSAKRPLEGSEQATGSSKKPKLETSGSSLYTIHGISCSAPVRKKLDVTITTDSISLVHATSHDIEAVRSLKDLNRAFLLPTPGKLKPHFTLILMNDGTSSTGANPADLSHVIFGVDAALTSSLKTTAHGSSPSSTTHPKNSSTLPILLEFASHLPSDFSFHDASREKFRSNVFKDECGVTAYLGAKEGHLYFFKEGILWGEKKPCMWYAVNDIALARAWSATGKVATLHLEQTVDRPESKAEEEAEEEELPPSIEFTTIDGRELDGIKKWVSSVQAGFGKSKNAPSSATDIPEKKDKKTTHKGPIQTSEANDPGTSASHASRPEEEDESDEEFNYDSDDSDGGEPSSDSSSESGVERNQGNVEETDSESGDQGEAQSPGRQELEDSDGERDLNIKKAGSGGTTQFKTLSNALAKEIAESMETDELESE
jgi:hypothetical protein